MSSTNRLKQILYYDPKMAKQRLSLCLITSTYSEDMSNEEQAWSTKCTLIRENGYHILRASMLNLFHTSCGFDDTRRHNHIRLVHYRWNFYIARETEQCKMVFNWSSRVDFLPRIHCKGGDLPAILSWSDSSESPTHIPAEPQTCAAPICCKK